MKWVIIIHLHGQLESNEVLLMTGVPLEKKECLHPDRLRIDE